MSTTTISHASQKGTPGQCFVAQLFDSHGKSIASLESTEDPAMATETARRLAACWNASIGLSTESLERSDVLSSQNAKIRHLEARRDDLIEALSETWRVIDSAGGLHRLATAVQLGPTVWAVKAHDARELSMMTLGVSAVAAEAEAEAEDSATYYAPKTRAWATSVAGNIHDVVHYVNSLGWSDFLVSSEFSGGNSIALFKFPANWPWDERGPMKAQS